MRNKRTFHVLLIMFLLAYLLFPLLATFIYSLATDWHNSIWPQAMGIDWFLKLFHDYRFLTSLGHSLLVCTLAVILSLLLVIPAMLVIVLYWPRWEGILQGVSTLPYGIPGVVAAVGLLKAYASLRTSIASTVLLLVGSYFVIILPYMYQGIRNSLRSIDAEQLLNAAQLLGASTGKAFALVLIPNIIPGIIVSVLLSFSFLFGEFAVANLLVGGQYETVQIYLMTVMRINGHLASALVILYFLFILLISIIILRLGQKFEGRQVLNSQEE